MDHSPTKMLWNLNEIPSAYEIQLENPPRYLYDKPTWFTNLTKEKDDKMKSITQKQLLKNMEKIALTDQDTKFKGD